MAAAAAAAASRVRSPGAESKPDDEQRRSQAFSPTAASAASTAATSGGSSFTPVAPKGQPSGGAGLAARRKFIARGPNGSFKEGGLQISTRKGTEDADGASATAEAGGAEESGCGIRRPTKGSRKIRRVRNFFDEYSLGTEVMPSFHRGMKVLNAIHRASGTEAVIKVRIKKESFPTHGEEEEWRSSTEFMLGLNMCSNIATMYEVLEDEVAYYVIMEKVSGQDLFESVAGQSLLPVDDVKEILCQILVGLVELHQSGHIHRDLKLENIMLDRTPKVAGKKGRASFEALSPSPASPVTVKLIDFDTVEEFTPKTPRRRRDVLGTDQYIAQEAYEGNYSPASDVFAVGVIAYRLLTGKFPFKADMFDDKPGENWVGSPKMKEIRDRLRNFKIRFSGFSAFDRDEALCDLITGMLAVNEQDRPSAATALAHPWLAESPTAVQHRSRLQEAKDSANSSKSSAGRP